MKVAIALIISSFFCLVMFLALVGPFGQVVDIIDEQAAEHLDAENYNNVNENLSIYEWAFGTAFIVFMVGGVIAAFVESHRNEYEEFRYYER